MEERVSLVKKFFLFCSGAHLPTLFRSECRPDHNKYIGIGSMVLATGLFGWLSSTVAIHAISGKWILSAILGVVWGLFIFALDRFLVSTLKKDYKIRSRYPNLSSVFQRFIEFLKSTPRILIACIFALTISKPFETLIFKNEVAAQIETDKIAYASQLKNSVVASHAREKNDVLSHLQKVEDELREAKSNAKIAGENLIVESNGRGGSGHDGPGPITEMRKQEKAEADRKLAIVENKVTPLIKVDSSKIAAIDNLIESEYNSKIKEYGGIMAEIKALDSFIKKNNMEYVSVAITALFLAIELAPLLFKILTDKSNYDQLIHEQEEIVRSRAIEEVSKINIDIDDRLQLKIGETTNTRDQNLKDNKRLLDQISSAQLSLSQEIINIWKEGELKKIRENPAKYVATLRADQERETELEVERRIAKQQQEIQPIPDPVQQTEEVNSLS